MTTEKDHLSDLEKLYKEKKHGEFLAKAEKLIVDYPGSFPINFLYGKVLSDLNKLNESENILSPLIQSYPDNINLLAELGNLYFRLRNFEKAHEHFNKILFLDPFNPIAKQAMERIESEKAKSMQDGPPSQSTPDTSPAKEPIHRAMDEKYEDTVSETIYADGTKVESPAPEDSQPDASLQEESIQIEEPADQYRDISLEPSEPTSFPEDSQEILPEEVERQTTQAQEEAYELDLGSIPAESKPISETSKQSDPVGPEVEIQPEPQATPPLEFADDNPPAPEPVPAAPVTPSLDLEETVAEEEMVQEEVELEMDIPAPSPEPTVEEAKVAESPQEQEVNKQAKPAEDLDFVTDSAAELYLAQGHYEEALKVYEKLYILKKDESYKKIIENVKVKCIKQKQIDALNAFLKKIQQRSEEVV